MASQREDERAFLQEITEAELHRDLQAEVVMYAHTRDGRYVWRLLLRLHEAKLPIPPEVFDKLAVWAVRLLSATSPEEIAAAIEFSGDAKRHIGPRKSAGVYRRVSVASEVRNLIDLQRSIGNKLSAADAIRAVARNRGLTETQVKGDYHRTFPGKARPKR